ncbi:hypothetical protein OC842_005726 [Tilletia horrida]|uniref:Uncharacterized protein n=1 Tax=Tilletia horrida TaxID=155126 RepID=A0AAN6G7D6_9BASI|nr:hypothetical protein OC842_005726 [Tilletia horrida]
MSSPPSDRCPFVDDEAEDRGNDSASSTPLTSLPSEPSDADSIASEDSARSRDEDADDEGDEEGDDNDDDDDDDGDDEEADANHDGNGTSALQAAEPSTTGPSHGLTGEEQADRDFIARDDEVEYATTPTPSHIASDEESAKFTDENESSATSTASSDLSFESMVQRGRRTRAPQPLRRSARLAARRLALAKRQKRWHDRVAERKKEASTLSAALASEDAERTGRSAEAPMPAHPPIPAPGPSTNNPSAAAAAASTEAGGKARTWTQTKLRLQDATVLVATEYEIEWTENGRLMRADRYGCVFVSGMGGWVLEKSRQLQAPHRPSLTREEPMPGPSRSAPLPLGTQYAPITLDSDSEDGLRPPPPAEDSNSPQRKGKGKAKAGSGSVSARPALMQ